MSKTNKENPLSRLEEETMRDVRALAATREGQQLRKALEGIDPKKLLAAFSKVDTNAAKAKLKGANAADLKKAMQNTDFLDKLK